MMIYGLLRGSAQPIIGELAEVAENERLKILNPAICQQMPEPFVNPITGRVDPSKTTINLVIISLPVSWVWADEVTELCRPEPTERVVQSYLRSMTMQTEQVKSQKIPAPKN